jgi:vitamin B12/bleomycin/antimicrobial peptide transport system ATP-binding/permease protein
MRAPRRAKSLPDQKKLMARFWQSASQFWREERPRAPALAVFLLVLVLLQLLVQFLLNRWNRDFFNALEGKDRNALWAQAQLFVPLAPTSILLAATSVWGRMTAQRSWRAALTRQIIDIWLDKDRFRHLGRLIKGAENPEYRIAVDVRVATDGPVDLTLALFSSLLTALTFFGVLWATGGSVDVVVFGVAFTIPGYLVFGVIIYSGVVSALMVFVGHYLTGITERMNQAEAEFRAAIDAFREDAKQLEVGGFADDNRQTVQLKLQAVLLWWREFRWQLVHTTLVSQGNVLFAPVVAWFLCVPKYLDGAMSLGELTQSAAAFVVVQGAFNWVVDNYQRLADWRSSAHRVATLLVALDEITAEERSTDPAP